MTPDVVIVVAGSPRRAVDERLGRSSARHASGLSTWSRARRSAAPGPACRSTRGPEACGSGSSSGSGWPPARPERDRLPASARATMNGVSSADFSRTCTMSCSVTRYDGMSTLLAVHREVAVLDQLAGHVAGLGVAGPVDHIVQARLEDLEQLLTRLARATVGLFVVRAELLLQHAVDAAGLLLLPQLQQVLALLGPAPAVLAGREGPRLERALRPVALASPSGTASSSRDGSGGSQHLYNAPLLSILPLLRPGDASADGTRCAAAA